MLRRTMLMLALLGASMLPATVDAGTLTTPSLYKGPDTDNFFCEAINVGKKPIKTVTVTLVQSYGTGTPVTCANLPPAGFCQATAEAATFYSGFCRITFTGSKANVRGAISTTAGTNDIRAILPAN